MNSQRAPQGGGLWNTNRPVVSSDTQNLLKSKNQFQKYHFFQIEIIFNYKFSLMN
jgi:hypothetical protein